VLALPGGYKPRRAAALSIRQCGLLFLGCWESLTTRETSLVLINGIQKRKTNFLKRKISLITHHREFKQNVTEHPCRLALISDVFLGTPRSKEWGRGDSTCPWQKMLGLIFPLLTLPQRCFQMTLSRSMGLGQTTRSWGVEHVLRAQW